MTECTRIKEHYVWRIVSSISGPMAEGGIFYGCARRLRNNLGGTTAFRGILVLNQDILARGLAWP